MDERMKGFFFFFLRVESHNSIIQQSSRKGRERIASDEGAGLGLGRPGLANASSGTRASTAYLSLHL